MIVLYGATGFTGGLAAAYLATLEGVNWAVAGRNADKLRAVCEEHGVDVPIIEADASDQTSLRRMTEQASVVISTVGPFARYGEPLVRACIETRTDYVDSNGEPQFVDGLLNRYRDQAKERGVRIVNCCGFDSIPHDIGAWHLAKQLPQNEPIKIRSYISGNGMISGGTWNSMLHAMGDRATIVREKKERLKQQAKDLRHVHNVTRLHRNAELGVWGCPLPAYDIDVVLRSASVLEGYGTDFSYGHHLAIKSLVAVAALGAGVGSVAALAQIPPLRRALGKLKAPGKGPDEQARARHSFRETLVGETPSTTRVLEITGGDVGYTETAKMLVQSALCLRDDRNKLPERYGILTTAEAMAEALYARLPEAGLRFSITN